MIYFKTKSVVSILRLTLLLFAFPCFIQFGNAQTNQEQHRPQLHFTPPAHWMNDPNGMVYYKGEYHFFYQYYPDSTVWGPMHWGHAVSKDLVHWEHLPIALYPDSLGYIFSGSAVIDVNNTSGFGKKGGESPMVAMYTSHNMANEKAKRMDIESQSIAYSLDKGRTWTKYGRNPVIKNTGSRDFRDPKVYWNEKIKRWVVVLAVGGHVEFYNSKDLKDWTLGGKFGENAGSHGGVWECPDLFPLYSKEEQKTKWILIVNIGNGAPNGGSGSQYFIGDFDGKNFVNDNTPDKILWQEYGKDNYAGVTYSNAPDNRRILIGWMSNWQYATVVPTSTWRSATTLPRTLSLHKTPEGLRLYQKPVSEFTALRTSQIVIPTSTLKEFKTIEDNSTTNEFDLSFDLEKTSASNFGIELSNSKNEKVEIGYDVATKQFYTDRTASGKINFSKDFSGKFYAPRSSKSKILKMHIIIDVASAELFADEGSVTMTTIFFPNEDFKITKIFSKNGETQLTKGNIWHLKSIFGY